MKIGVVIPYYKAPEALAKCVKSLEMQEGANYELFVRDNSIDNILYTAAVNEGLKRFAFDAQFDATLVLTQDAILRPGCVQALSEVLEQDTAVGIACPVSVTPENKVTFAGGAHALPWGRHLVRPLEKMPPHPYPIYWANGACLLFRHEMVKEIGLVDENMRFVCSDADYSFTARARGWKVVLQPKALIEHELAESAKSVNADIVEVKRKDQQYFEVKWAGSGLYEHLRYPE